VHPWIYPVTSWQPTKVPSSLQDERLVLAVPNWRQFAWEVAMIIQHFYRLCLLGDPPCWGVAKSRTLWLPSPSVGKKISSESRGGISQAHWGLWQNPAHPSLEYNMLGLSWGLYRTAYCHVGKSESLHLPEFFSLSHFCTTTQWPFCPQQHWVTFLRNIWEDTMPSFIREIDKASLPTGGSLHFLFPTFCLRMYAPMTESQFRGFLWHLTKHHPPYPLLPHLYHLVLP
jgi:hypothetical protein